MKSIHTSTGSIVTVAEEPDTEGGLAVIVDNPNAPDDMRNSEAGRIIQGGFQPAPFAAFGFRPEMLRAIAILTEENSK